tara:strand:+ start:325 stop:924 length:600 start_codon:yes stop_codon:yes gene_type:complete
MSSLNICRSCGVIKPFSKVVVGKGNPLSRLIVVGEAPGANEEKAGIPFVGRSGILLDALLEEVGINPVEDVYMCNAVKCRPPNNRRPTRRELELSKPWLLFQIELVDPLVIILAGSTAVQAVMGINDAISTIRGNWLNWRGTLIMPIFHPAYLIRNPSRDSGKPFQLTLLDLAQVRNKLNRFKENPSDSFSDIGIKENL